MVQSDIKSPPFIAEANQALKRGEVQVRGIGLRGLQMSLEHLPAQCVGEPKVLIHRVAQLLTQASVGQRGGRVGLGQALFQPGYGVGQRGVVECHRRSR